MRMCQAKINRSNEANTNNNYTPFELLKSLSHDVTTKATDVFIGYFYPLQNRTTGYLYDGWLLTYGPAFLSVRSAQFRFHGSQKFG